MGSPRVRHLWPTLLALASAGIGARLLAPRESWPEPASVTPADYFSSSEMRRGARFTRPQLGLALLRQAIQVAVLGLLLGKTKGRPRRRQRPTAPEDVRAGALVAAKVAAATAVAGLPVTVVARRRAIAAGLDTQSWAAWGVDVAKATALGQVLAAGAGAGITALIHRYPRGWWAPAAGASVGVVALLSGLGPVVLDPLFSEFTPLPEGRTRSDVLELARSAGVNVGEVFSVDASRRTRAANAYVTGVGPTKRVVLFDTLLDRCSREEIRVVVAHELSHVLHRDVLRGLALAALTAPAAALAVQRLGWALADEHPGPEALPALALAAAAVIGPVGMVTMRFSRAVERRADLESLELSGAPEAFISLEQELVRLNLADVEPPLWVRLLLASHPPPLERIGLGVAYRARRAAGGS